MKNTRASYVISPFGVQLNVYFSSQPAALAKRLSKANPQLAEEMLADWEGDGAAANTCAGFTKKDGTGDFQIFCIFDTFTGGYDWASLFAHEAIHVVSRLYLFSGTKYDSSNDEPTAYLVDHIVGCFVKTKEKIKS